MITVYLVFQDYYCQLEETAQCQRALNKSTGLNELRSRGSQILSR